jgi:hypothetical protein
LTINIYSIQTKLWIWYLHNWIVVLQLKTHLHACCLCILLHNPRFYGSASIDAYQRPFHWPHNREIFFGLCLWQKNTLLNSNPIYITKTDWNM